MAGGWAGVAGAGANGQMIGIRITLTTIISRLRGTPERTKSLKR
jgi:hypothetical protein